MKNKNIKSGLSILLLALVLIGNVGLHIFHHHEAKSINKVDLSKASSDDSFQETESDCLLCHLDGFQEFEHNSFIISSLLLAVNKPVFSFFVPVSESVLIFSKGRSPPVATV